MRILSTIIQPLIRSRASIPLSLETVELQGHLIWMDQIAFGFWQRGKHPDATSLDCRTLILLVIYAKPPSRFVFLRDNPQQNGVSLLTPVSDSVFIALSDGTIHFAPHGSSLNHNLIG